jgi:predicted alpha/beta hydrolase family esterase
MRLKDTRRVARYVLVHGAWHGAWCFRALSEALERLGHEATAVDLPSDTLGLTPHDYAARIGPQPDAIVLGHSLGAQTVALVDARCRVYLGGILPVANPISSAFADGFGGFVRDELGRSYWPDADTCAARLYPDCSREQSDRAFRQLRAQAPFDAIDAPFGDGDVVIATMRDHAVNAGWQVRTAQAYGARVVELDSGHSPFFTQPAELAGILTTLVATS